MSSVSKEFIISSSKKNKKAFGKEGFYLIEGAYRITMFADGKEIERIKEKIQNIKEKIGFFQFTIAKH